MTQWYRNVGIDLGLKSAHEVAVIDPNGKMFRFKCGHGLADMERMLTRLERDLPPGGKLRFVMEPTDTAWVPMAWFLVQRGHEVYLVPTLMAHDFREALSKYAKCDRIDGATLASLPTIPMAAGRLNRVVFGSQEQETLKRLVKHDFRLATGMQDRKKRVESFVRLALPAGVNEIDLFSPAGRYLCSHCLNPAVVVTKSVMTLAATLAPLAGVEAEPIARTWHAACEEALAMLGESGPVNYIVLQWQCRTEMRWLRLEEEELSEVRETIAILCEQVGPVDMLQTAPGVGPVVAAAVAAAIGDHTRFPGPKQFRAYTGIVPKVSRSGVSESRGKGITKAGPNWLKRQLYMAADWARRLDPQLGKVYHDQMVKYGHHHKHAVCAVATRLADRLFICYRDQRPYEIRDLEGNLITAEQGRAYVTEHLTVPEEVRQRLRRGTGQRKRKTQTSSTRAS